ncbi:ribonuclease P protein component [Ottowia sp.]|jgi:ribonuclease P protein component|uniref:ribonuclease P protein component n=1 Tax=Ottowia sp. TaxID=1898956 RepID=UPI00260F813B|nr:ribonuclease P protein component [Ottowia sp.]
MHRLKTRPQFQAAMAGGTVSRTAHFALHRLALDSTGPQALFAVAGSQGGAWLGAMVPKRWARRAVTRNAIKRQIYAVARVFEPGMPHAAHVVRLRTGFDRKHFVSATSDALKRAVRAELEQLFAAAERRERAP